MFIDKTKKQLKIQNSIDFIDKNKQNEIKNDYKNQKLK